MRVNGEIKWLVPVIAFVITDWPEGQSMSLTKAGATTSKRNCRLCTKPTLLFNHTDDGGEGVYRTMKKTKKAVQHFTAGAGRGSQKAIENEEREWCVYMEQNGFWSGELYSDRYGHHAMFPYDILHTICHGTADVLLKVLLGYGKKYKTLDGKGLVLIGCRWCSFAACVEIDERLRKWPPVRDPSQRMMHTRQFNSGVSHMAVFTADDMIALLQQLPFVVGSGTAVIGDRACAAAFVNAAVVTRNILSVMKQREVSVDDLNFLKSEIKAMGGHFETMQNELPVKERANLSIPKFHSICHFP